MHGRSLVRSLDSGIVVIVTIAVTLLGLLAWAARSMDKAAFETETAIVHRQISRLVGEFRADAQQAAISDEAWLAQRPQEHAIIVGGAGNPAVLARETSRIGQLLSDAASRQQLAQALLMLRKLDPKRQRVDFALIGPQGDENLALIAQQPTRDGNGGLLVTLLDFPALSTELEAFAINLLPVMAANQASSQWDGQLQLSGYSGETIARLGWDGRRFSDKVLHFVMPAMAVILAIGLAVLLALRHSWTVARDGFLRDIKAVGTVALTDTLTAMPNRRALFEQFRALEAEGRHLEPLTLLLLDLSGVKWVNEVMGHRVGDEVIIQAARVFNEHMPAGSFVARLGGDAFVALVAGDLTGPPLQTLHSQIAAGLSDNVLADVASAQIGVHIGAVCTAQFPGTCEELLRLADLAVTNAKEQARGSALVYAPSMKEEKLHRRKIEQELALAIDKGELVLHHQPIVDAMTGKEVTGYESLVRWNHPERGLVSPAEFIPVAEQSALIVRLGNYVLDRALRELGPLAPCRISVNATGRQLLSQGFVEHVGELLAWHKVEASRLCLELTETSLIEDGECIARVMTDLRALGVKMAIDDFGVGYSSLSHLLRYKFDVLKIDRDFVVNLDDKPEAPMIVTAVVTLARSLGMQVVGEGIETPAQHRFLASAGCNALQGYLFGRPVPVFNLGPELDLGSDANSTTTDTPTRFQAA